jgi:hypothetical protein
VGGVQIIQPGTRKGFRTSCSHFDDHHATLRGVTVLFIVVALVPILRLGPAALVTQGDLEARPFMAPPLLFLATTDLFDDPRFEHAT